MFYGKVLKLIFGVGAMGLAVVFVSYLFIYLLLKEKKQKTCST